MSADKNYCIYCMTPISEGNVCPVCGASADSYSPSPHHLMPGTILMDRYLVGRVLGEGGFGITYIGFDFRLELKVAIKEYFPLDRATRNTTASLDVNSYMGASAKNFERGKKKFLEEARVMARMAKQQVIVSVRDYFEANNTAYIVMEYVEGTTFRNLVEQKGGKIPPRELFPLIEPLFDALAIMHENGLIHRDISPDNMMLENGNIRLLDFGCAREASTGAETMTVAIKYGYAPLEQYQQKGQGAWTDIYALCATIYFCLTGEVPPQALDRIVDDTLLRPSKLGISLTEQQEKALLKGLQTKPKRRFQTVRELQAALYMPSPEPVPVIIDSVADSEEPGKRPVNEPGKEPVEKPAKEPVKNLEDALKGGATNSNISTRKTSGEIPQSLTQEVPQNRNAAPAPNLSGQNTKKNTDTNSGTAKNSHVQESKHVPNKKPVVIGVAVALVLVFAIVLRSFVSSNTALTDISFEDAIVLSDISPSDLQDLMDDPSVSSIILESGIDFMLNGTVITKPVLLREGNKIRSTYLTITETGFLRVEGEFDNHGLLRLEGEGVRFDAAESAVFRLYADTFSMVWRDREENLSDSVLSAGGYTEEEYFSLLTASEEELIQNAVTVSTPEELQTALEEDGAPIVIQGDLLVEELNPRTAPVIIAEGATVSFASSEGGIMLDETSLFINHGSLRHAGFWSGKNSKATVINYGSISAASEDARGSDDWFEGDTFFVNFGEMSVDQNCRFWPNSQLLNLGHLDAWSIYIEGGSLLNCGELDIREQLWVLNGGSLDNYNTVTLEENAALENHAHIYNNNDEGIFLLKNGADDFRQYGIFNNGGNVIRESSETNMDGIFFGSGSFENTEVEPVYYQIQYPEGTEREAHTVQELTAALQDDSVDTVRVTGEILCDSDLTVTKNLILEAGLEMAKGTSFLAEHAVIVPGGRGSYLRGDDLRFTDGTQVNFDNGVLEVPEGGSLTLDASIFLVEGQINMSGANLILTNQAIVTSFQSEWNLEGAHITLENGSVFTMLERMTFSDMTLEILGSAWNCIRDCVWERCHLRIGEGANWRNYSQSQTFSDCTVEIERDGQMYNSFTDLSLTGQTEVINRGNFWYGGWDEYLLTVDGSFVNYGEVSLNGKCKFTHSLDNQGTVYYTSGTNLGINSITGNPPINND